MARGIDAHTAPVETQLTIYKGMYERERKRNEELNRRIGALSEALRRAGVDMTVRHEGRLVTYWGDEER